MVRSIKPNQPVLSTKLSAREKTKFGWKKPALDWDVSIFLYFKVQKILLV
jgi:hypothetical protein